MPKRTKPQKPSGRRQKQQIVSHNNLPRAHHAVWHVKKHNVRLVNNEVGPAVQLGLFESEPIHPANTNLCPWLTGLSKSFEQWRGRFVFTFKSDRGVTDAGQFYMAIDRDANDPAPTSIGSLMANQISNQCHIYDEMTLAVRDDKWRQVEFSSFTKTAEASNAQDVASGALLLHAFTGASGSCGTVMVSYDIEFRYPTGVNPVSGNGYEKQDSTVYTIANAQNYSPLASATNVRQNAGETFIEHDTDGGLTDTLWERDIGEKLINYAFEQTSGTGTSTEANVTVASALSNLVELTNTYGSAAGGAAAEQQASATWAVEPIGGLDYNGIGGIPDVTFGGTIMDLDAPVGNIGVGSVYQFMAQNAGIVGTALSAAESAALEHGSYVGWSLYAYPRTFKQAVKRGLLAKRRATAMFRTENDLLVFRIKDGRCAQATITDGSLIVRRVLGDFQHDVTLALSAFPSGAHIQSTTEQLLEL